MPDPISTDSSSASRPVLSGEGASGVDRIAAVFEAAKGDGRAALMPYMMGAFPDPATATAVAEAYAEAGADLIELGIPFSDPLADGPTIHSADTKALANGATFDSALAAVAGVADRVPVLVMCYANMVLTLGAERFAGRLADAGAAGAIVPDMPLEEATEVREALAARGLALVPLVAPTTPDDRLARIAELATGFVYVVSTTGTTGERKELAPELRDLTARVRETSPVPAAVGFGISTPEQAAEVGEIADGVIIGTRLVRAVDEADSPEAAAREVSGFLAEVRDALSR
ncbi:MAG: tryptophan synthase alpha chain [Solirubrobacterales bacterium]|jgi:tryptophan synthase alpha chain|nr:tryptophan synthase alpha chain [Solirubrobacterales bacterium]